MEMLEIIWRPDDVVVREIMNGIWFILGLEVLLALLFYVIYRAVKKPRDPFWLWVMPTPWYNELGTQLAIAWMVFISGSVLRAGWIWLLLECENRLGRSSCEHLLNTTWLLYVASLLAITGGVCTIRVMLLERWRPWSWIVPGLIAVTVPVVVHFLI